MSESQLRRRAWVEFRHYTFMFLVCGTGFCMADTGVAQDSIFQATISAGDGYIDNIRLRGMNSTRRMKPSRQMRSFRASDTLLRRHNEADNRVGSVWQ